MKNILVTGATGLVGHYLLLELAESDDQIFATYREESSKRKMKAFFDAHEKGDKYNKINWRKADLLDVFSLESACENIDRIYHLAAFISFNKKDNQKMNAINHGGTENLVNEAIAQKIPEIVYLSTIATLNEKNKEGAYDENSKWDNEIEHSGYAISKYKAEMEIWRGTQEGLNAWIICPSVIIGSLDGKRESEKLFKIALKKKTYSVPGGTGFVDVRDVVKSLLNVTNLAANQKWLASSENVSFQSNLDFIRNQQKLPKSNLVSLSKIKTGFKISHFLNYFGLGFMPKELFETITQVQKYDASKLKKDTGILFYSVEESLTYHLNRFLKN